MYASKPIIHLIIEKNVNVGYPLKDDPKLLAEAIMKLKVPIQLKDLK